MSNSGLPTHRHRFGGDWTQKKLEILAKYLRSYTRALRNQPFQTAYIDAFAGSGYRNDRVSIASAPVSPETGLFPDIAEVAPQQLLEGSAVLALKTEPSFDHYIFVERNPERCKRLADLRVQFPQLAERIDIRQSEANQEIQQLCGKSWSGRRAVLFLDPYGMQVEFETLRAVAGTRAIDLWLLFPLGIGINRLLTRSGRIPDAWRRRLDRFLGTADWYDDFYSKQISKDLFGNPDVELVKAKVETIAPYFTRRLQGIFAAVAGNPRVLYNASNCPIYMLCFAAANPKGSKVAIPIAEHLLKRI